MEFPAPFGPYQLLDRIAVGGMAEVFLARRFGAEGFEKRLVIKRILPDLARNPRFVSMFVHEAKLSVSLNHPNIVQVFDLGKVDGDPFMAMEFIHGRDLTQLLRVMRRNGERMKPEIAAYVAAQVARGLAYAHARVAPDGRPLDVVHRDISPHNVMLSFEGDVKIVDFGIARLAGETAEGVETGRPGGGKFAYMSPEQARGEPLDARTDIFALGVVLYEMLAGRRLFQDGDPDEKLRMVVECVVPDIRAFNPEVDDGILAILGRALAARREDRYADAGLFEEDLRAYLFEIGARDGARPLKAALQAAFAADLASDQGPSSLDLLAEDLQAMHTGLDPEPSSTSSSSSMVVSQSRSDDRGPRMLGALRGERKHVVALVAEVNGLTELSARAETEDVARVHYRLLRLVRTVIDHLGGQAERFDDDTLVVFFGLPRAHGDDLDRALACARELHRLANRLRKRGLAAEFSVGVHVGELHVSKRVGRHSRYTARGDTLKSCVRLAYAAEPGTTLVSDRVAALAGDRFPFDRGPELRRKGSRGTRATFLLAGPRRRGGRGAPGRWLRRGDELEILRDAIATLGTARGVRIAVRGEPGMGKSRLLKEFRELAARRGIRVFHGRALPFGADRHLAPFRDLVSDILGIEANTSAVRVRERLGRLAELHLDPGDIAVMSALFSVELGERVEPARDAIDQALVRLVRGLAADGPTIVILEDIQYMDEFERSLLDQLVRAIDGEPVLLLVSARGDTPKWPAGTFRDLALLPLEHDQVVNMAAEVLGSEGIGPDLARLLSRTAEGNPLYLEEILKALQQAQRIWFEGAVARLRDPHLDPGLPDTLQGLVAARVDALDPVSKGALQVAAVLGMSFSPQLLGEAVGADEPMALLGDLVSAGLVAPEGRSQDTAYAFRSVLVWESVNRSIPGAQRKEFHRMVAGALERIHDGALEPVLDTYAQHCQAGGRWREAIAAVAEAGDLARRGQFLERALDCYLRGVAWFDQAPREDRDPTVESRLHVGAGEIALLLGLPTAERMLQVGLEIAGDAGPRVVEARALLALGAFYRGKGRLLLARANLDSALSLARRLKEVRLQVEALEALGASALDEGSPDEARMHFEEGLKAAGQDHALVARMQLGLASRARATGDLEASLGLLQDALQRAEAVGDRIVTGRIVNNIGIARFDQGAYPEALAEFRRALEIRRGLGYRIGEVVNLHNIADTWLRMGDLAHAYASFEQSRDVAKDAGWDRGVAMNEVYLLYVRGLRGDAVGPELEAAGGRADSLGDRESAITARAFAARLGKDGAALAAAAAEARAAGFDRLANEIAGADVLGSEA
jgi:serine/threonine protein kinase/predicted ATPase